MATVQDLIGIRSAMALSAIAWLHGLADALDQTDWYFEKKWILASDTVVDAFVYTKRRKTDGRDLPPQHAEGPESERSAVDESVARLYEQPREWEEREKKRWRQTIHQPRLRLGVRGAPGGGKTFLTRNSAVALARESAGRVERREISLNDAPVPFWLTAGALAASAVSDAAMTVVMASQLSIEQINRRVPLPPRDWFLRATASPGALIFVDALDQLVATEVEGFERGCRQLDTLDGRLIATCRTMHWDERASWLGWSQIVEVELAPFERREQREFTKLFPRESNYGGLAQLLKANYPLRQACGSPLLLAFVCLLHAKGKSLAGANRVTLYADMVRQLLSGEWRNVTPPWAGNAELEGEVLEFLESAALSIFSKAPEANRFTFAQWKRVGSPPITELLSVLDRCGVLVAAGFDDLGARCWSFLHRTLLEFLAARALAHQPEAVWLAEAKKHFWYEPEWIEVLTFLAAHVKDATPLIEALDLEQEDIFCSILYLKARLASVSRWIDPARLDGIVSDVEGLFAEIVKGKRWELWEYYLAIAPLASGGPLREGVVEALTGLLREGDRQYRGRAAWALGQLGDPRAFESLAGYLREGGMRYRAGAAKALGQLGDPRAFAALTALIRDGFDEDVQSSAAEALGQLGDPRAFETLAALLRDTDGKVNLGVLSTLGRLGDSRAFELLAALLRDAVVYVRSDAAKALGQLGDPRAIEALAGLLRDEHAFVQLNAARALGQLGDPRAFSPMVGLLQDEVASVRGNAAEALGQLGDPRAFVPLASLLQDEEASVRGEAAEALGQLGDPRAFEELVGLLQDKDVGVQEKAAKTLGRLGDLRAFEPLTGLSHDEEVSFRARAAWALGQLGDPRAFEPLTELLDDDQPLVRYSAASALGKLGDLRAVGHLACHLGGQSFLRESAIKALRKLVAIHRTVRLPRL